MNDTAKPARARRPRGIMEALLRIMHILEALALVFGVLAVWGVTRSWEGPVAVASVLVLLLATIPLLKYRWGWTVSLLLQGALVALGFIDPLLTVVGLVFLGMWIFCFVKARQIQAQQRSVG